MKAKISVVKRRIHAIIESEKKPKEEQAMAFRIGFAAEQPESKPVKVTYTVPQEPTAPRKSVVQVYFADSN